tara:strand:+ start:988 stop:1134 length:147 start_codon:yes stop_codon:yes gene_type:complete
MKKAIEKVKKIPEIRLDLPYFGYSECIIFYMEKLSPHPQVLEAFGFTN